MLFWAEVAETIKKQITITTKTQITIIAPRVNNVVLLALVEITSWSFASTANVASNRRSENLRQRTRDRPTLRQSRFAAPKEGEKHSKRSSELGSILKIARPTKTQIPKEVYHCIKRLCVALAALVLIRDPEKEEEEWFMKNS